MTDTAQHPASASNRVLFLDDSARSRRPVATPLQPAAASTAVLITVDTELSVGAFRRGVDPDANLARAIFGECADGAFGIHYQIARLNAAGLKAVFFVDPIPATLFGLNFLRRVVAPILDGGHEVQLHIHTEWLQHLERPPVANPRGRHIRDLDLADQIRLVEFATDLLVAAGAPRPIAFRAGNYGADDCTLEALAFNGLSFDTSFNGAYLNRTCRISLPADQIDMVDHCGVTEVPITVLKDWGERLRAAQLCALSAREMASALRHAIAQRQGCFTVVLHSFELLSRDRLRANRLNIRRFEQLCTLLAELRDRAATTGFEQLMRPAQNCSTAKPLRSNVLRTSTRMAEQLLSTWLYEKKLWRVA